MEAREYTTTLEGEPYLRSGGIRKVKDKVNQQ